MTHPFHPLSGREFPFVAVRRTWKQHRVFFFGEDGTLDSLPAAWTDVAEPDVFVAVAGGRSPFRVADLLALAEVLDGLKPATGSGGVRRILPSA
ncbi:MAG TPA: DUF5372 family protein [Egibacteraceae bacterium]|nr:DUF5372 family protein [Egibacteraceae bacterium]